MKAGDIYMIELNFQARKVKILVVDEAAVFWIETTWIFPIQCIDTLEQWNRRVKVKL